MMFNKSRLCWGLLLVVASLLNACDSESTVAKVRVDKDLRKPKAQIKEQNYVERLFETVKNSKNRDLQTIAIRHINNLKADEVQAEIRIVLRALQDSNKVLRLLAVNVLRRQGSRVKEQKIFLKEALEDSDLYVRTTAAQALIEMGESFLAATRVIIAAVKEEPEGKFKHLAVKPLMKHASKAREIIPYLKTELACDNADIRALVLTLLVKFGPEITKTLKARLELLKSDTDYRVAGLARMTLEKLKEKK
jgi:HEAT repeat protein